MDSLFTIPLLYEVVRKQEFQEGLVDLLYVTAKNKEEASGKPLVKIPNTVTSIKCEAFSNCSNLRLVYIPNSVTSIRFGAFSNCSSLTSVNIPNSVNYIDLFFCFH